jgi:hypothetical protein
MTEAFAAAAVQILVSAIVVYGGFSVMAGQALARTWRSWRQCLGYAILLSVGARLTEFVLFIGRAEYLHDYVIGNAAFSCITMAYFVAVTLLAHRITRVRMMVTQYPWLYERAGLLSWRTRGT